MDALTDVNICRGRAGYYARVTWAGMLCHTTLTYPTGADARAAARLWMTGAGWL